MNKHPACNSVISHSPVSVHADNSSLFSSLPHSPSSLVSASSFASPCAPKHCAHDKAGPHAARARALQQQRCREAGRERRGRVRGCQQRYRLRKRRSALDVITQVSCRRQEEGRYGKQAKLQSDRTITSVSRTCSDCG